MTEEEKKEFLEISKRIGYKIGTYCNEEEIRTFEKILEDYKYKNNLIQLQRKELEKKDKIIDEMAEVICRLDTMNNYDTWENNIEDVKQYFEKKVEGK